MVAMSGAAGDCPLDPEHYNTTCECTSGHTGIPACDTNNYTSEMQDICGASLRE